MKKLTQAQLKSIKEQVIQSAKELRFNNSKVQVYVFHGEDDYYTVEIAFISKGNWLATLDGYELKMPEGMSEKESYAKAREVLTYIQQNCWDALLEYSATIAPNIDYQYI